jgi:hypothetical protein
MIRNVAAISLLSLALTETAGAVVIDFEDLTSGRQRGIATQCRVPSIRFFRWMFELLPHGHYGEWSRVVARDPTRKSRWHGAWRRNNFHWATQ